MHCLIKLHSSLSVARIYTIVIRGPHGSQPAERQGLSDTDRPRNLECHFGSGIRLSFSSIAQGCGTTERRGRKPLASADFCKRENVDGLADCFVSRDATRLASIPIG